MKKLFTFLFAFMFTLSLGLAAYAKETKTEEMNKENSKAKTEEMNKENSKAMTRAEAFTFKANDIIGAKVENREGKSLGKITELGIDPKTDRVAFAVISHGGAVGVGGKDIAVPLKALSLRTDENGKIDMFVLNMSEDRFANAPSFDKNSWPDKRSAETSYRYFGQHPYWSGEAKGEYKTTGHMKKETTGHMKSEKKY